MNKLKQKIIAATVAVSPVLFALAEGESQIPNSQETPQDIADLFTPWINAGATALVSLLTAGAVIVGVMFVWRLMKKGFGASK